MSRTILGLGPLEAAIMTTAWQPASHQWLDARTITGRLDYPKPLSRNTVSTVAGALCRKGLLQRRRSGRRWEYQAARTRDEHIGDLIAALLDAAHDPPAALACALRRPVPTTPGPPQPASIPAARP